MNPQPSTPLSYTLHLPDNYQPPPLPGGLAWVTELRKPGLPQTTNWLKDSDGECCLGVLSRIQGRLNFNPHLQRYCDGKSDRNKDNVLAVDNPLFPILSAGGRFPAHVFVKTNKSYSKLEALYELNDNGLTFPQIADIISKVWDCQ